MKIAIVGWGIEGQSVYRYFGTEHEYLIVNEHPRDDFPPESEKLKLKYLPTERPKGMASNVQDLSYLEGIEKCDKIVYSPTALNNLKTKYGEDEKFWQKATTSIEIFFENAPTQNIIGVTGTKGKGTTSSLITKILEATGHNVHLGGNIGRAVLDFIANVHKDDWVVLELSSFQLASLKHSPHIAVCLTVEPEHLDWHKDIYEYIYAKQQLFRWQKPGDIAIYYADNMNSRRVASISAAQKIPYMQAPGAQVLSGKVVIDSQTICNVSELQLVGKHNWQNVCAAVTTVWEVTQDIPAIRRGLTSFAGLEHRLEYVAEIDQVKYYDDSFASSPTAPGAAMIAIPDSKVMIMGGFDRGLDLSQLAIDISSNAESIRKILLVGQTAKKLAVQLDEVGFNKYRLSTAKDMVNIVKEAQRLAKPGDSVVLSPGFASFDMFNNFEQRGTLFKQAVSRSRVFKNFIFKDWQFDKATGDLTLNYSFDNQINFTEKYKFDFKSVKYNQAALDRAIQGLFLIAGVSYYKTYRSKNILINKGNLDAQNAKFFSKTYQRGLGEFFYINNLNPRTVIPFTANVKTDQQPISIEGIGQLIAVGGGKDSLVSIEFLRDQPHVATWSLNHKPLLKPLIDKIGLKHYWVEREWDESISNHNRSGAYNGHIPISAIFAFVGTIVAVLSGHSDVVMSNESSANEPDIHYQGMDINHQYSKSLEFERDYQTYLKHNFSQSINYYSFLRPLSELHISKLVAGSIMDKYQGTFSSCNRAYIHGNTHLYWCGKCPKCAFVFLALTPFVKRERLEDLFGSKNLLTDPLLELTYRQLLGIDGDKPLDCVGEIKESRTAMRLAQHIYPELKKYKFDIPADYDYLALSTHSMPSEIFQLLKYNL